MYSTSLMTPLMHYHFLYVSAALH